MAACRHRSITRTAIRAMRSSSRTSFPFNSVYWLQSMSDDENVAAQMRDAYLRARPWCDHSERLRVWELGWRLTTMESTCESELLKQALNFQTDTRGNVALLLLSVLDRWDSVEE